MASDVDGTLLGPLEQVTPRTARVVQRVIAAGIPFVLVTGRPARWVPNVAAAAGVDGIAVCANGAVLYDIAADRVIEATTLDPVLLADAALAIDEALPNSALAMERTGQRAAGNSAPQFVAESRYRHFLAEPGYEHPWPDADSADAPRAEILGHPAVKLLVRNRSMTSSEMATAARAILGSAVDVTFSTNSGLIEVSAPGVTKATGLAKVAERHGVEQSAVIAFGDMPNDISMLRWAGHGVAMANAHDTVRTAADETTAPNSEDGVALVLERWF